MNSFWGFDEMNSRSQHPKSCGAGNEDLEEILSFVTTGNAVPVLHEVRHALTNLLERGDEAVIDLGAIPFAPGDERQLTEVLGEGEASAVLSALGESRVYETGVPGVWRVDHFDRNGDYMSRLIEITFIPAILKTQHEDAQAGLDRLVEALEEHGRNRQT